MSRCIECAVDGSLSELTIDQRGIATHLGGSLTFVGGVPDLDGVFVVACEDTQGPKNEACSTHAPFFFKEARGRVVFIASDEDGEAADIDVGAFRRVWDTAAQKVPQPAQLSRNVPTSPNPPPVKKNEA